MIEVIGMLSKPNGQAWRKWAYMLTIRAKSIAQFVDFSKLEVFWLFWPWNGNTPYAIPIRTPASSLISWQIYTNFLKKLHGCHEIIHVHLGNRINYRQWGMYGCFSEQTYYNSPILYACGIISLPFVWRMRWNFFTPYLGANVRHQTETGRCRYNKPITIFHKKTSKFLKKDSVGFASGQFRNNKWNRRLRCAENAHFLISTRFLPHHHPEIHHFYLTFRPFQDLSFKVSKETVRFSKPVCPQKSSLLRVKVTTLRVESDHFEGRKWSLWG